MINYITSILLFLFTLTAHSQELSKKWQFDYIRNFDDTTNLIKVDKIDYLQINNDGTFKYEINSIALKAYGKWELDEKTLSFHYISPLDTIRFYSIKLSENKLILQENDIEYAFKTSSNTQSIDSDFDIITILRGLLGILVLIGIAFIFSRNRSAINWPLVFKGLMIQIVFAIGIFIDHHAI